MSPFRNASKALADVMVRSERRGAEAERRRLAAAAQRRHEQAEHEAPDFRTCPDPGCMALTETLETPPA